jgi:hypothetical protein
VGRDKSNSARRAARERGREQRRGLEENEQNAQVRIGQFGQNWQPLTVKQFADRNGLTISFAGFWEVSDSGKKVEGTDPTSGYTFVMDSTRAYYRVQDSTGSYVDADGLTIADAKYAGDANAFNLASHFANRSA